MEDIEKAADEFRQKAGEGFAAASWVLAQDEDSESFIFRKFSQLSARNLLYLQCEILVIEDKLRRLDRIFLGSSETPITEAARKWEKLVEQSTNNKDAGEMMQTIKELRSKLREYHETLKLQSEIAGLHRPEKRAVEATRHWLEEPLPILGGKAARYLSEDADLVALKAPTEVDILSKALRACWPGKDELSRNGLHRIRRYNEHSITVTVGIISIVLAAILLLGAIIGFSFVTTWAAKLVMICFFTIAFALSVGLTTNAKRAEIFAATAAYAAVLVVFVSNGDLSGNQQCCQAAAQQ